jgi:hypothetical protein
MINELNNNTTICNNYNKKSNILNKIIRSDSMFSLELICECTKSIKLNSCSNKFECEISFIIGSLSIGIIIYKSGLLQENVLEIKEAMGLNICSKNAINEVFKKGYDCINELKEENYQNNVYNIDYNKIEDVGVDTQFNRGQGNILYNIRKRR